MRRVSRFCCALVFASAASAAQPAWRPVPVAAAGIGALAFDPSRARVAIGDERGVWWGDPAGGLRRGLFRGPVRDLVFAPGGALLAATGSGLFHLEPDGRSRELRVAPGAEARDTRRLAAAQGLVAVATAAGVYVSAAGERWQPASRSWPSGESLAVALRARGGAHELWGVVDGRLFSVRLEAGADGLVERGAQRHLLPGAEPPGDVLLDVAGSDVVVLRPDALLARRSEGSAWQRLSLGLAPGARILRLRAARGSLWLATDRGLWVAAALAGPWRRASAPLGTAPVRALAGSGAWLLVAAQDGVRMAGDATSAVRPELRLRTPEGDPPIELVQRAVLDYLDLTSRRSRELRRGVARRGWLPIVSLRAASGRDRDRETDRDQSFVSGATREVLDRQTSRSEAFDASLTLSWDLGDVLYHPEAIDVSREAREIIKLRDDVLDEVNQLYFERRRVLAELAGASGAEAFRLRLRAAELAAGLDAWTGGWFHRVRGGRLP